MREFADALYHDQVHIDDGAWIIFVRNLFVIVILFIYDAPFEKKPLEFINK